MTYIYINIYIICLYYIYTLYMYACIYDAFALDLRYAPPAAAAPR